MELNNLVDNSVNICRLYVTNNMNKYIINKLNKRHIM